MQIIDDKAIKQVERQEKAKRQRKPFAPVKVPVPEPKGKYLAQYTTEKAKKWTFLNELEYDPIYDEFITKEHSITTAHDARLKPKETAKKKVRIQVKCEIENRKRLGFPVKIGRKTKKEQMAERKVKAM